MNNKTKKIISKTCAFVILALLAFIWLIPLLWAFGTSFKADVTLNPTSLFPAFGEWTGFRYVELLTNENIPMVRWFINSIVASSLHTVIYLLFIAMAAYAFVFIDFKMRSTIFFFLLASMMIPSIINLIPNYVMQGKFGWFENSYLIYLSLIIPGLGGVFGLFLVRGFFLGIPKELIEASKVDGANDLQIFIRIILPIGKSALMVAAIFAFMGVWNDFMWPSLIFAGIDKEFYTLAYGLTTVTGGQGADKGLPITASIMSAIPVIIVYLFAQNKIIDGVSHTGMK
ncbi:MAG: carbohydrate ABC transporter permease [Bacilli bacterium]